MDTLRNDLLLQLFDPQRNKIESFKFRLYFASAIAMFFLSISVPTKVGFNLNSVAKYFGGLSSLVLTGCAFVSCQELGRQWAARNMVTRAKNDLLGRTLEIGVNGVAYDYSQQLVAKYQPSRPQLAPATENDSEAEFVEEEPARAIAPATTRQPQNYPAYTNRLQPQEEEIEEDYIGELAEFETHLMGACKSRSGKSTFLRALMYRILQIKPNAQFLIGDPKTSDWLGLQKLPGVVTYLVGNLNNWYPKLDSLTKKAADELQRRIEIAQQCLLKGESIPEFDDLYLLLDEWYAIYDELLKQGSKKQRDRIIGRVNQIAAKGAELKVHFVGMGQSHLCTEIGFSSAMRKNFVFFALGRMGEKKDVGYDCIADAIDGKSPLISRKPEQQRLLQELDQTIEIAQENGDRPVCLITVSKPKIFLVPDLLWINDIDLVGDVKNPPAKNIYEAIEYDDLGEDAWDSED